MSTHKKSSVSGAQKAFKMLKKEREFTIEEKKSLLKAMKVHGVENLNLLLPSVPRHTYGELRNYLALRKQEGMWRVKDLDEDPPLEQWLHALRAKDDLGGFNPGNCRELCRMLQLIALTEKHPPPEECGGVDFSALYMYLHQAMSGVKPRHINKASERLLFLSMRWLGQLVAEKDTSREVQALSRVSHTPDRAFVKTYGRQAQQQAEPHELFDSKKCNPLGIPRELLKMNHQDQDKFFPSSTTLNAMKEILEEVDGNSEVTPHKKQVKPSTATNEQEDQEENSSAIDMDDEVADKPVEEDDKAVDPGQDMDDDINCVVVEDLDEINCSIQIGSFQSKSQDFDIPHCSSSSGVGVGDISNMSSVLSLDCESDVEMLEDIIKSVAEFDSSDY